MGSQRSVNPRRFGVLHSSSGGGTTEVQRNSTQLVTDAGFLSYEVIYVENIEVHKKSTIMCMHK